MNDDDVQIMTGPQVADLLQVPPRTMEEWRQTHSGPPWRRVGRHFRYVRREVLGWFGRWTPMPRQRMTAGEMGTFSFAVLASGQVRAQARTRDEFGEMRRLKAVASDESKARIAREEQAERIRCGDTGPMLNATSTIAQASAVFLDEKPRSRTVEFSSVEPYEFSVNNVIIPVCCDLLLRDLTVLRCNRILQKIRNTKSLSGARKARSMLSQICATGIDQGVLEFNPVRDAKALPVPPKKESILTPDQLAVVRELVRSWRADGTGHGPRPNLALLENVMWIMVGTSARIGEVLALRRFDVDVTTSPPTVLIAGTITQTREEGLRRTPCPKLSRKKRRVALPSFSAAAIRHQPADAASAPESFLFPTKTARPLSVSNFERLLRTFVGENEQALKAAGVDTQEFTIHVFRRTAATLVESVAGTSLAARLLVHASEQVTRANYVVTAELVDRVTAQIMDEALEGLLRGLSPFWVRRSEIRDSNHAFLDSTHTLWCTADPHGPTLSGRGQSIGWTPCASRSPVS
jgi:integrase